MMNKDRDRTTQPNCGRKDELLDYLYGEANATVQASFERHLDQCNSCRDELGAFGRVRDNLSTWQVGYAPRTEVVLPRRRLELLREFISSVPAWWRGAALAGATVAIAMVALSLAHTRIHFHDGDFAIQFGAPAAGVTGSLPQPSEEIERQVRAAVARQQQQLQVEFAAQAASLKQQLLAEHEAQLKAVSAGQQAKIQAVRASLRSEIARVERLNRNVRPFFDSDDYAELWSTGR
jgi:anti-sigma factor RsiW